MSEEKQEIPSIKNREIKELLLRGESVEIIPRALDRFQKVDKLLEITENDEFATIAYIILLSQLTVGEKELKIKENEVADNLSEMIKNLMPKR